MSRRTIDLVQASWAKVMPISDAAAALFYDRLFELDPSVRPLFKPDINEQKKKLMQTLSVAVDGLMNLPRLVPVLQSLGVRHAGYMVVDRHYDTVGEALLWTLREGLGDDFTDEVQTAWIEVYTLVADVMKKAAADHGQVAARPQDNLPPMPFGPASLRSDAQAAAARDAKARGVVAPSPKVDASRPRELVVAPDSLGGRTLLGIAGSDGEGPDISVVNEPTDAGGPLSAHTIALVQTSWAKVMPISDAAASLFYDRLFEMDPSVKPMFKSDMREQKKKLMQMLAVAVDGLGNLDRLVPVLQQLGVRHAGYMVAEHHYDLVGSALLWTLREGLGDDFTDDVEAAWTDVYTLVADVMKAAAADHTSIMGARPAPKAAPAPKAPQAATGASERPSRAPNEDDVETLHFDSSRRPPIITDPPAPAPAAPAKSSGERRTEPVKSSARVPAAAALPPPPVRDDPTPPAASVMIPLGDKAITLNVHLTLDGPLPTAPREPQAPAAPDAGASGGLAPALLLASLCAISSMALATLAPGLGAQIIPQFDVLTPLAVPILVLVLILAAFGLGYLWGRGRRAASPAAGAGPRAGKP